MLARDMGMTAAQLMQTMSPEELQLHIAHYQLAPWGAPLLDYHLGRMTAQQCHIHWNDKHRSPPDVDEFRLHQEVSGEEKTEEQHEQEVADAIHHWFAMYDAQQKVNRN